MSWSDRTPEWLPEGRDSGYVASMKFVITLLLGGLLLSVFTVSGFAAEISKLDEYLTEANNVWRKGEFKQALEWIDKAIEVAPDNPRPYLAQGYVHQRLGQVDNAIKSFSKVIEVEPRAVDAYNARGGLYFGQGQVKESIEDFNKEIELAPSREPHHWQRGLSFYYAGLFDEGRNQFELHRSVNPNDVENAVWHLLCVARKDGLEAARQVFIPIEGDSRVPMMEIHKLFGGVGTVDEVLAAVQEGNPNRAELILRNFFAHLYLGLFFEISGDQETARYHIEKATSEYSINGYMGNVARVHKMQMDGKLGENKETKDK